jgi:2-methylisocitrate lyase-like PEP mutase family enzyme
MKGNNMTQQDKARLFKQLHEVDTPLLLTNIWDAGSARAVAEAGAKAIATGSWSVAAAHGYSDGEKLPLTLVLANLERIVASVDLPVSIDIEAGYSTTPEGIAETVTAILIAGAVGINLEDQIIGSGKRYDIQAQVERIHAARNAAQNFGLDLFINARTDVYLQAELLTHSEKHLEEAIERGYEYAGAGANGFFVPGLRHSKAIATLCKELSLPVNIMLLENTPSEEELASLGVARISKGPRPYLAAMNSLRKKL